MVRFLSIGLFIIMTALSNIAQANDRVLNITEYTTPEGITLWHVEDHSLPIITMNFAFRGAGSIDDPRNMIGLGQLVSNTIDEGAGARDANAFQEALQDHAIDLSFSNDRDNFTGKIKTLKRHKDLAFELLRDAIHTPRFDSESVERMRQANITRIKSSVAKPDWVAARLMNDVYFGDHPYALNSGGTISGLSAVTPEAMKNFVTSKFTKGNLVVSTAGDMSADEAMSLVDQIFSDLPDAKNETADKSVTPPSAPMKKAFKKQSPQSVVQMVWPSFAKTDPDYHALMVMNHLLGGGGFSSYLMEEVREKKGLTYGIYSYPTFMDLSNSMSIASSTSPENVALMTQAVQGILTHMKTKPAEQELLDDAKSYLIGSLPLRFSSTLSLSGTAQRMQLDGRDINALDNWADNISKITADDVMRVANRIFESVDPTVTIIAGAVPDDQGFDIVDVVPGVE